jgi:glycosyltransferase involved in cell wall biosynthesis
MSNTQQHIVIDARNRRASSGRYTARLLDHLQAVDPNHHYTILVEPDDPWQPSAPYFSRGDAPYKQFSFNPLEQIQFARQLYRLKPDLVHFTMTQQPLLYFGRIITTTHDLTMLRYTRPSRFPRPIHQIGLLFYRFLMWFAHRRSQAIIVPTQFVANDVQSHHPFTRDKLHVTYEATEPPLDIPSAKPPAVEEPFIMHVGAPYPHKNLHRLIQAFDIVRENHPELYLYLPGKMKDEFKRDFKKWRAAADSTEHIIAPGFVPDEELKWLYENARMYVLPSLSEGFGLPGLEAMVHGCPLASSSATCLPEVYGDAAIYYDPLKPADIAEKIVTLLENDELRQDLIAKGYKKVTEYSWRDMATETLDIYQSTLK